MKVIVKQNRKSGDGGGTTLYMELVYLESLRGRPGVPELLGAWWEASRLTYATVDGGEPISAEVPPLRTGARRFATWAQKRPLRLARSLLACFWSWASAGCAEINQCVGCTRQFFTKSFLGDDVAVLAPSSGEELAHRATPSRHGVDGVEVDP